MTFTPAWRTRLYASGATLLAVWIGASVAAGELLWPAMIALGLGALVLTKIQRLPLPTVLLGLVVAGYILGNRGFAQISLLDRFPLLPAEAVLLAGFAILTVQSALRRELPVRRDLLNLAVLMWVVAGIGRLVFDFGNFGFSALRDFALVYYAAFFFLAQHFGREAAGSRFIRGCVLAGCAILPFTQALFSQFPEFFLGTLTVRGIPLIFYKGDLASTFMAVGAVGFFLRFDGGGSRWFAVASLALGAAALSTNNRASMLGLAIVTALLAAAGRWRFAALQAGAGVLAVLATLMVALVADVPLARMPLHGLYERVVSIGDPLGERDYSSESTADKGDNNLFRAVWWQTVFEETVDGNPTFGLGFGYDLADRFVRRYYAEAGDEFSARSPHNVVLTVFARMGLVGLAPFIVIIGLIARRGFRAARAGPAGGTAEWCAALVILVSACFGVVLEGPMGAVVFWIVLGLANAASSPQGEEIGDENAPVSPALLPTTAEPSSPELFALPLTPPPRP